MKSPEQPLADAEEVIREDDREDDIAEAEEGHPSLGQHVYRNDDVSDTDTAYMTIKQHLASTTPHLR